MTTTGDAYSFTICDERFYMLNNPRDAADTFQNTKTLDWEPHLKVLIVSFAIPRSSFAKYGATLLQTTRPA